MVLNETVSDSGENVLGKFDQFKNGNYDPKAYFSLLFKPLIEPVSF
jgi:hypothetical protein